MLINSPVVTITKRTVAYNIFSLFKKLNLKHNDCLGIKTHKNSDNFHNLGNFV